MNIKWDSQNYKNNFSFVPKYGEDVMNLITKPKGSKVLDLGCGNGTLTSKLKELDYNVIGIDASYDMIDLAKKNHPDIQFSINDALSFKLEEKVDVIFSNAVFHWIDKVNQDKLLKNIYDNLNDDGELVCEFGGYKCAEKIHSTLEKEFESRGLKYPRVFYFPTIGEYCNLLEKNGLLVEFAHLFPRPTPVEFSNGVVNWINMFVTKPFEGMDETLKNDIIYKAQNDLMDELFIDGKWYIDYVRIRIRARKVTK
ncbi:MAG: class I SAM-dependent methyltransferase [Anaeroplasmataceae bacterium]